MAKVEAILPLIEIINYNKSQYIDASNKSDLVNIDKKMQNRNEIAEVPKS